MNEEENFLNEMKKAYAIRDSELKSKFKTMLFTYRNALGMLSGLKNELDEVVSHIEHLEIETISSFYKPVLEKANDLVSKIEKLESVIKNYIEIKNHIDIEAYLSLIKTEVKSHNIDKAIKKFDGVMSTIIEVIEELERRNREEFVTIDGLMWEKETREMNWHKAMEYAKNLRLGGYDDWRLPTIHELKEVVRSCGGTPGNEDDSNFDSLKDKNGDNSSYQSCYKNKGFKYDKWYWSSTSISGYTDYACVVNFYYAYENYDLKDDKLFYLRCVRAGQ